MRGTGFAIAALPYSRRKIAIVVQHDRDIEFSGYVGLDRVEKAAEFLRTMSALPFTDDAAGLSRQGGKQGGGAVPFVVVGAAFEWPGP